MTNKTNSNKPRTMQEILDAVIEAGFYSDYKHSHQLRYSYMCLTLDIAYTNNIITLDELWKAKDSIEDYLIKINGTTLSSLRTCLYNLNRPSDFSARLAIYKNWKNRPYKKLKVGKLQ